MINNDITLNTFSRNINQVNKASSLNRKKFSENSIKETYKPKRSSIISYASTSVSLSKILSLKRNSTTSIVNSDPSDFSQVNADEYDTGKNQTIIFRAQHSEPHLDNEYFTTHDNNSNTDFVQTSDSPTPKMASSKQEHIININSGIKWKIFFKLFK